MRGFKALLIVMVITAFAGSAFADSVGRLATVQGDAKVVRGGEPIKARAGMEVHLGDLIQTGDEGRVKLMFRDGTVLNVGDDSRLKVTRFLYDPSGGTREGGVELVRGTVRAWVTKLRMKKNRFEVQTPTAVAGVRGTHFAVRETKKTGAQIVVFGGEVAVRSSTGLAGECLAREGMSCLVRTGQAPGAAEKSTPAIQREFRGSTRVAARLRFESTKLASLIIPRINRMDSFKPRFSRVGSRSAQTGRFRGARPTGNMPGAGNFGDTITPAEYVRVQVIGRTRPNY